MDVIAGNTRRRALLACVCLGLLGAVAAGCGGEDPTAPRDVRAIPAEDATLPPTDADAPSRGLPCDVQTRAGAAIGLCGAATDNYKASFNEDPQAPERRTWLAVHELELDGVRWRPAAGAPLTADEVRLERVDGEAGALTLSADVADGPGDAVTLRTGPQRGLWGPLLTIRSADALHDAGPVTVRMTVQGEQGARHEVEVRYRHDAVVAGADATSLEHRGPGGRWEVAGIATATNLELGWE